VASRRGLEEALSTKIREVLESAEKEVVKVAVETLLEKGATIETDNLEIDVKDSYGNTVLKISTRGTINIKTTETQA